MYRLQRYNYKFTTQALYTLSLVLGFKTAFNASVVKNRVCLSSKSDGYELVKAYFGWQLMAAD